MLSRFFKKEKSNVKAQAPKSRKLRMELLEDRALLSVAPFEYAEIRALYPAFALPENRTEINVIDLAAATTSAQVQAALDAAKATPQDDLIVWRTTAEGGSARFDRTLTVDFDASVSGSLTLVSYGDALAQVSSAENAVFSAKSGDVRLGGFAFVGKENGASGARDLTPVADGATLTVERSIYLKQSGGDVCEDVVGKKRTAAAATTSGIGGAALDDVRFAADFQVDGSTRGYVAGLTLTEAVELAAATHSFQTPTFFDVDKSQADADDDELCWAATASNMLKYTGFDAGMTLQEIFDEFKYCFTNVGGNVAHGCEWFLTGDYPADGWNPKEWAQIENEGGAHYSNVDADSYISTRKAWQDASVSVSAFNAAASLLKNGGAVGLSIGWFNPGDYKERKGGHGATMQGYYYDSSQASTSPDYYTDLIISCSDDYAGAPRRYRVALDYADAQGCYVIKDYDSDGAEDSLYGVLEYFYLLKPNDGAEPTDGLVVTTNADVVDANDGVTSLREAIAAAQTGDAIRFAPSLKGKTITLTQGQLEITQGITVDAGALYDEATQTPGITIDADEKSRVFLVSGGTAENPVALRGLTITGGKASGDGDARYGGGVYASGSSVLTVANSAISGNKANYGGGVYAGHKSAATFTNCAINDNSAVSYGGGVYVYYATTTFTGGAISGNTAPSGGGVRVFHGVLTVENGVINGNEATDGGGIYALAGKTTITNGEISDNAATKSGGGVYVSEGEATFGDCVVRGNSAEENGSVYAYDCNLTFTNCEISENSASTYGGGVYAEDCATIFTNSVIIGNVTLSSTSSGGGVYVSGGTTTFTDCEIRWNFVGRDGGGVYASGTATFTNCLIVDNIARNYGGGVCIRGDATFTNCTISENRAEGSSPCGGVCSIGNTTFYNSIVAQNTTPNSHGDIDVRPAAYNTLSSFTDWSGGSNNYVYNASKPLFVDAANGDFRLAANSQAINKGNNSYISGYSTDLAGNERIVGGKVDLGAYEYGAKKPATQLSAPSLSVSATSSSSLNVTIGAVANATGYTLQYSTSSSFTSSTTVTKTYSSAGTYTLTGLAANTTYYVRVLAKGDGTSHTDSEWSSVKSATTKTAATRLAAPSLSVVVESSSEFSVTVGAVANATSYTLEYSTSQDFSASTTRRWTWLVAGTRELDGLTAGTTYYLRVRANGDGTSYLDSEWSSVKTATTKTAAANKPNLRPGALDTDWDGGIALSTSYSDWSTRHATTFSVNDTIYIGGSVKNVGDATAKPFAVEFALRDANGTLLQTYTWERAEVPAGHWYWAWNGAWSFKNLAAGTYTVTATVDSKNVVAESDETDNVYVKTFRVVGAAKETPSLVVTTNLDVVDAYDGKISLREAILYAETNAALGDTITFASSTKGKTITLNGADLEIERAGLKIDASDLYDAETETPGVTIDAVGRSRGFNVKAGTQANPVTIKGLTITGGSARNGGGIYVSEDGALALYDSALIGNRTTSWGGGGLCADGPATVVNCRFVENEARDGGGLCVATGATLTLADSTFIGNAAFGSGWDGGAIRVYADCVATIDGCEIRENKAAKGGGISVATGGKATISNSTIADNVATVYGGGGLETNGEATISNSTITGNSSPTYGGGINVNDVATIVNSEITDNKAQYGGGIHTDGTSGVLTLTGSTVSNNVATAHGGGLCGDGRETVENCVVSNNTASRGAGLSIRGADATATLTDVAITGNVASSYGGGVYSEGTTFFANVLIAGNSGSYGGAFYGEAGTATFANATLAGNSATKTGGGIYAYSAATTLYNAIVAQNTSNDVKIASKASIAGYNSLSSFTAWNAGNNDYVYVASQPLFKDAENGDFTLAENSQALNKGNDAYAVDADGQKLTLDLAGKTRVVGGTVDLGAYEYGAKKPATQLSAPSLSVSAASSSSIKATIGSVANATGYTLQYSTSSSFTSSTTVTKTYSSAGTYTLTGLAANTKYYVRVLAKGDGVSHDDSVWSSVKSATTPKITPPTLTVTTTLDVVDASDGVLSLREAISLAEVGSTIKFASSLQGKTIVLNGKQLEITQGITVDASNLYNASTQTPGITVDANQISRVFSVSGGTADAPVALIGLKIAGGYTDEKGGGLKIEGDATLKNVTISNCASANVGGGIDVIGVATFENVTISDNGTDDNGGGVYVAGKLTATGLKIFGNAATGQGGGLYVQGGGSATITNAILRGNSARSGAGGMIWGDLKLTNALVVENAATKGGGGFYLAAAELRNVTIVENAAAWGSAAQVHPGATPTFYNSILAASSVTNSAEATAYNVLSSTAWASGSNNYVYDASKPLFVDAANGDYRLATGSQAIGKGNNSYISGCSIDLAGNERIVGGTVDLGAYEYGSSQEKTQLASPSLTVSAASASSLSVKIGSVANAASYALEYSTTSNFTSSTTATKTYSSAGTYTLTGLAANTTYYVRVLAKGDGVSHDDSAWSSVQSATTAKIALTGVTINGTLAVGETLTANVSPSGATATYQWYYGANASSATTKISGATTATFAITNAYVGKYLKVVATGTGDYSGSVSATVDLAPPAAPTNVKFGAYDAASKNATLTWKDNATNETRYEARYSVDDGATWTTLANLAANSTSRVCGDLDVGETYLFQIRAVAANGLASDWASAAFFVPAAFAASEYVVEQNCAFYLSATDASGSALTHYWDLSGAEAEDSSNFIERESGFWASVDELGFGVGEHTIRMRSRDADGNFGATVAATLRVKATIPTIHATASTFADGLALRLDLRAATPDGSPIERWRFDWGDGQVADFNELSYATTAAHYYAPTETDAVYETSLTVFGAGFEVVYALTSHSVPGRGAVSQTAQDTSLSDDASSACVSETFGDVETQTAFESAIAAAFGTLRDAAPQLRRSLLDSNVASAPNATRSFDDLPKNTARRVGVKALNDVEARIVSERRESVVFTAASAFAALVEEGDELDFFIDEDDLDALALRRVRR